MPVRGLLYGDERRHHHFGTSLPACGTSHGCRTVHFGIIMVINLAIGFITPSLDVNLFVAANVAQTTLGKICKGIVTIIGVMILD